MARLHGVRLLRRRPGAVAGRPGHRPAARDGPPRRDRGGRGRRRAPHGRARRAGQRRRSDRPADSRVCGSSTASGARARRPDEGGARDGCSCSAVDRPASSSRRSCVASAVRWCWSRAPTVCWRASRRRWARRSARPCAATASSSCLGVHATAARARRRRLRPRARGWSRAARRSSARRHRPAPARRRDRARDRRHRPPTPRGIPVDSRMQAGERLWAIGDVTGIWQLTHVGEYQGEVVARTSSASPARPTTRRSRASPTPTRRRRPSARPRPVQRHRAAVRGRQDRHLHARVRRVERLPDAAQRRRAPDRRVRARSGGRGVAAASDAGDPRPRPARRAARHDPAVPELLGDPRRRDQGAPDADRIRPHRRRPGAGPA